MASPEKPAKAKGKDDDPATPKSLEIDSEGLKIATGSSSDAVQFERLARVIDSLWIFKGADTASRDRMMQAAYDTLMGIAPQGELEGMLAAQMIGTYNASMECLKRAMIAEQSFEARDQNLKHAAKLMSIYERQLAALDKHRGKGQQRITVEHVTVEAGGQAIVGNVLQEGGEQKQKAEQQALLSDNSAADALSRDALKSLELANMPAEILRE